LSGRIVQKLHLSPSTREDKHLTCLHCAGNLAHPETNRSFSLLPYRCQT